MKRVFTGRNNELNILNKTFTSACEGLGSLILINGNAGIGKSGLMHEFMRRFDDTQNVITSISECNDKENLNPYAPFKDTLIKLHSENIEKEKKGKKGEIKKKLKQFVSEAGTKWIGLIPLVGGFAAAGIETFQVYQKTFKDKNESKIENDGDIFRIFESELRQLAENKTLIIFIDDIQWADASSLNLIFALGKAIRNNPFKILLVCTYRPDEIKIGRSKTNELGEIITVRHPFADKLNELRNYTKKEEHLKHNHEWFKEIDLQELTHNDIKIIINNRFRNNNFQDDFINDIISLTNGHPLFLNEILDFLVRNENIIQTDDDSFEIKKFELKELPISVNAIISEKIERLNEQLRKIISYASICGEKFIIQEIEKVLKIDEFDLLDYLDTLNNKYDLIIEDEPQDINGLLVDLYRFSQTLVQRYVYENIDNARRRRLHKHIAATIKSIYRNEFENNQHIQEKYNQHINIARGIIDGATFLITKIKPVEPKEDSLIFESLIRATNDEILKASDSAKLYANDECYEHAVKALAFLSKIAQKTQETEKLRFEALSLKYKSIQWSRKKEEAHKTCAQLADVANYIENYDINMAADFFNRTADAFRWQKDFDNAEKYYQKVISYENNIEKEILIFAYSELGEIYAETNQYDKSYNTILALSKIREDYLNDEYVLYSFGVAMANHSLGVFLPKAEQILDEAFEFFDDDNDHIMTTKTSYHLGVLKFKLGKFKEAKFYLKKARIRYERWNWDLSNIDLLLENIENIN